MAASAAEYKPNLAGGSSYIRPGKSFTAPAKDFALTALDVASGSTT